MTDELMHNQPDDQLANPNEASLTAAWQEIDRLGLIEIFNIDVRPSVIIDLNAVDLARGKWGQIYTNPAYESTPTSETWTKFERENNRRVYIGPPGFREWTYGHAPSPDPTPIVRSKLWIVNRVTIRSRWRIVQAVRREQAQDDNDSSAEASESAVSKADKESSMETVVSLSHKLESFTESLSDDNHRVLGNGGGSLPLHPFLSDVDWSLCSMGSPVTWPQWKQQFLSMVMTDMDPAAVVWRDRTVVYNELVVPVISEKHPLAQGSDIAVSFKELWALLEPMMAAVIATGKPKRIEAMPLPILRRGYLEETFWNFTLVPIFDDEGKVEGILDRFNEITTSILAARRLDQITQIGEKTIQVTAIDGIFSKVMEVMDSHKNDVPYSLIYSISNKHGQLTLYSEQALRDGELCAQLKGAVGMEDGMQDCFKEFNIADRTHTIGALARQAFAEQKAFVIRSADGTLPKNLEISVKSRGFGDLVQAVVVVPVMTHNNRLFALLIQALNPRRRIDSEYYAFMRLMTRRLVESFSSVALPQEERSYRAEVEKAAMDQAALAKQLLIRTKEAEHSASAFARLAANAPLGMYMYSAEGRPLYLNDYFYQLTGIAKDNPNHLAWLEGVHPDERERLMQYWKQLYGERVPVNFEFRMNKSHMTVDQNGSEVAAEAWALSSAFPQLDEDGEILNVIGWQVDISAQKWAEKMQKERLKDALESRSQAHRFIDMVSHECRNPLSAILQSADGILNTLGSLNQTSHTNREALKDCIDSITDSASTIVLCAQHQKRIVDDILTVSKLDGKHLIITPDKADPVALVEHVLRMYEAELEAEAIQSEVVINRGYRDLEVEFVLLDPSRVLQILINMVTNAIKFTAPQKKRKILISIDASLKRPSQGLNGTTLIPQRSAKISPATTHPEWVNGKEIFVQFSVKDTGRGMSPEEMAKLFERFTQASPRTHVKYGGSGLGLFISRELTELQGGQVSVSSTLGLGSTFAFYVSARRSTDPLKNSQSPVYTPGPASSSSSTADPYHSSAYPFPKIPNVGLPFTSNPIGHPDGGQVTTPAQGLPSEVTPTQAPVSSPVVAPLVPDRLYILIVEDNLINQKVMAKQLQRLGCVVHVANHGLEALNYLKQSEYATFPPCLCADDKKLDVILMDIEMPVMDGVTCVKEIRAMQRRGELHAHVPVIAVTANARDAQQAEARDVGMDTVVTKPFRIPDLIPIIHGLMKDVRKHRH